MVRWPEMPLEIGLDHDLRRAPTSYTDYETNVVEGSRVGTANAAWEATKIQARVFGHYFDWTTQLERAVKSGHGKHSRPTLGIVR